MPLDGGNLLLSDAEKNELLRIEPNAEKFIIPLISAHEFLNGENRWCIWLANVEPSEVNRLPEILKRVEAVKNFRLSSKRPQTIEKAVYPSLLGEIREFGKQYILIPRHSSENRKYIPIGFFHDTAIPSDSCIVVTEGNLYMFGQLTSAMHMTWVKHMCGRIKSDFRYSKDIVYNNYPFPQNPTEKQQQAVEAAAQSVLDARAIFPGSSLADLYNPLTMPPALLKAHQQLDKAVDLCYRPQPFTTEASRMEFLFDLYNQYTKDLFTEEKKGKKAKVKIERIVENLRSRQTNPCRTQNNT